MALRNWCFDRGFCASQSYDVPVLSVGNITVGGTGKTPHIEYLIRILSDAHALAVLSRGYGRKTTGFQDVRIDSLPSDCGDEPCQIKRKFPSVTVVVCEDRREGMRRIMAMGKYDAVLLDDAYQHRWVRPSWSVLLVDYARPLFKDAVMPAGRMREFASGIKRADSVWVTKCPASISDREKAEFGKRLGLEAQSLFFTNFKYGVLTSVFKLSVEATLDFEQILLVTGIARPQPLADYLKEAGAQVCLLSFSDHHLFTEQDVERIWDSYYKLSSSNKCVVTTEKDAVRFKQINNIPEKLKECMYYLPIEVNVLGREEQFNKILLSHVRKN